MRKSMLRFLLCAGLLFAVSCGGGDSSEKGNNTGGDAGRDTIGADDAHAPDAAGDTTTPDGDGNSTCEPSCDLIACGASDGCGGVCGCANGEGCLNGTCQAAGESCAGPIPLDDNGDDTWTGEGDLSARVDTLSGYATALSCAVAGDAAEGDEADEFFAFTAPADARYEVVLTAHDDDADVFFALFDGTECKVGKCLALVNNSGSTHTTSETFELEAGKIYTIAVEAASAAGAGRFSLQVAREACVPSCASGACGMDDGCGQPCACQPGEDCNAGVCTLPTGESCADALNLVQNGNLWTGAGDLSGAVHSVTASGCERIYTFGAPNTDATPSQVWRFTTTDAVPYTITLTPQSAGDLLFYVFSDAACDDNVCLGIVERVSGTETHTFSDLQANHTYYVVVEPYYDDVDDLGTYTLEVEKYCAPQCTAGACGTDNGCGGTCGCGAGEECDVASNTCEAMPGVNCSSARAMTQNGLEWTGAGDLSNASNNMVVGGCQELGTYLPGDSDVTVDEVWSFTTDEAGAYTVTLERESAGDIYFYVFSEQSCDDSVCLGVVERTYGGIESQTFDNLAANHTYYIVVEPYFDDESDKGTYTLKVRKECELQCSPGACGMSDGCGGVCGCAAGEQCDSALNQCEEEPGQSCATARQLVQSGNVWSASGDLSGAGNHMSATGCPALSSSTPDGTRTVDNVWAFTTTEAGAYKVSVTRGSAGDLFFYVFEDAACQSSACLGAVDKVSSGSETHIFQNLAANHTYYIVVEPYSTSGSLGTYTVEVEKQCDPQCGAGECGVDNGCGGTCGCAVGMACEQPDLTQPGTCEPIPGDSCALPAELTRAGDIWSGQGDLSLATDVHTRGACPQLASNYFLPTGAGSPDQVWSFTPDTAGPYKITVDAGSIGDFFFYLYDDASCEDSACLGYKEAGTTQETHTFDLEANHTYYLVVDMYATSGRTGTYTVEVEKLCAPQCAAGECGMDNGCGGTCGCTAGNSCAQADPAQPGTCEPTPGDSCALPAALTRAGDTWSGQGDLSLATDQHTSGTCPRLASNTYSPTGAGSPDQVWSFTTGEAGRYTITVSGGTIDDFFFYLYDDASCGDSACLGYMEKGYSEETHTFELEAAHTYYLVVDLYSTAQDPGTYDVEVTYDGPTP